MWGLFNTSSPKKENSWDFETTEILVSNLIKISRIEIVENAKFPKITKQDKMLEKCFAIDIRYDTKLQWKTTKIKEKFDGYAINF